MKQCPVYDPKLSDSDLSRIWSSRGTMSQRMFKHQTEILWPSLVFPPISHATDRPLFVRLAASITFILCALLVDVSASRRVFSHLLSRARKAHLLHVSRFRLDRPDEETYLLRSPHPAFGTCCPSLLPCLLSPWTKNLAICSSQLQVPCLP